MDIGKYKAVTKPLAFDFDGEVINLTYRPNIYTVGLERRLRDATKDESRLETLPTQLSQFIASWDLEEDGQPIPLTVEGLSSVPAQMLIAIDNAIGAALVPSEEEKKGSSEPSALPPQTSTLPSTSSPESGPTSLNGSATSESPTVSESVPST